MFTVVRPAIPAVGHISDLSRRTSVRPHFVVLRWLTIFLIDLLCACWLPKFFSPGVFVVKFNLCAPNHVCAIRATTGRLRFELAWADRCCWQTRGKANVFVKRKSRGRGFAGTTAGPIKKRFKREEGDLTFGDYAKSQKRLLDLFSFRKLHSRS